MNTIYFILNSIGYLSVAVACFYALFTTSSKKELGIIPEMFTAIGVVYLGPVLLNAFWAFNLFKISQTEFITITTIVLALTAILISWIIHASTGNNKNLYILLLFLLAFLSVYFGMNTFIAILFIISHLVLIIQFLDLLVFRNYYLQKSGVFGLAFSIVSIIIGILFFDQFEISKLFWILPNAVLTFTLLYIVCDIKRCGTLSKLKIKTKKQTAKVILFLRYMLYIICLSSFILFSTVAIHELGHALTAKAHGCERSKAVIFDINDYPHTELICEDKTDFSDTLITLGGLFLTIIVGLIFLIAGGGFTTKMSYLIFGFALLINYSDFKHLGFSDNAVFALMFVSVAVIITAVINISKEYLNETTVKLEDNTRSPAKGVPEKLPEVKKNEKKKDS